MIRSSKYQVLITLVLTLLCSAAVAQEPTIQLGSRRELFIDQHLIEKLDNVRLHLHEPRDEGIVLAGKTVRLRFVLKDADLFALRFASGVEHR